MSILSLIVLVILLALAYWAVHRIATAFSLPPPIVAVLDVILVILAVVGLLGWIGRIPAPWFPLR